MKLFDSHFHIIDSNYPLVPNNGYLPPMFNDQDYRKSTQNFNVQGGAVVSGSFQAFDQEYLINALQSLGKGFYGVANIPMDMSDDELHRLNDAGVVAVRFNLKRGGSEDVSKMVDLSNKLFDMLGWHTELYVDSKDLPSLKNRLEQVPRFSIDHLGLSNEGFKHLLSWVEKGIKVKATGFGRIDFDTLDALKQIHQINPDALMFGTDLPSTRAKIPFSEDHLQLILDNFEHQDLEKILFQNALTWYSRG